LIPRSTFALLATSFRRLVLTIASLSFICISSNGFTQAPAGTSANSDEIARIAGLAMTRGGASSFLETLTDRIGGRITGSPESRATADLILKTLKEAGFDNAHLEEYDFNPSWQKGTTAGEIVSPVHRSLYVGTYGWAPGTPGPIEVPVVDAGSAEEGSPLPKGIRGAAALIDLRSNALSTSYVGTRAQIAKRLADAGAAAMMIISDKPDRMLYTSAYLFYPRGPLPSLSIAAEDAALLRRLMTHGEVKIRLNVQNSFGGPAKERNVVADLPGEDASALILLTAHFDSWDPAQAANDNGCGVAMVLESARILKSMGIRPKHTIRFVFFSGEEQSDLGSRAYVEQHQAELDHTWAAVNTDSGAQAPLGLQLYGREDLVPATRVLLAPLASLGINQISTNADFESDEESFMAAGVPVYSLLVEHGDYDFRHHTIIDTFEHIDPRALALDTAVMAITGYQLAQADQAPGRRLTHAEVLELMRRYHLELLYKADYDGTKP
jgi:Iap family predicted aminopeptidase